MADVISVRDYRNLQRAFAAADKKLSSELSDRLKSAAEPVKDESTRRAGTEIRRMERGSPWTQMRIGVTRSSVYVAPVKRGTKRGGRRRPNLAPLLLERAMVPALDNNRSRVIREIDQLLDDVGRAWERA